MDILFIIIGEILNVPLADNHKARLLMSDGSYRRARSTNGENRRRSQADFNVQTVLRDQLQLALESVAGVNLEEEAVNMLRYQEAYLAASKMISVSNDLFQSIINAIR